eukprot:164639_1
MSVSLSICKNTLNSNTLYITTFIIHFLSILLTTIASEDLTYTCPLQAQFSQYSIHATHCFSSSNHEQFVMQVSSNYSHSNSSYIDIYFQSDSNHNCISPQYNLTYYHQNITIYNQTGYIIKQCQKQLNGNSCKIADTCIINDTTDIKSLSTNKITLYLQSDIKCYSNPKLSVQCTPFNYQHVADLDDTTNISLITCTNDKPCHGNVACPEGKHCKITCYNNKTDSQQWNSVEGSVCHSVEFYCPPNSDCSIDCIGTHACVGSTFHGVNGPIICKGNRACYELKFEYSNLSSDNTVFCSGFGPCTRLHFDINVGNDPHWFMITNADGSEQITLSTRDYGANIFTISSIGNQIEPLKTSTVNIKYLNFCHHCKINVRGSVEGIIEIIEIYLYNFPLLIVTLFIFCICSLYLLINLCLISKNSKSYYLPFLLFMNVYGKMLIDVYWKLTMERSEFVYVQNPLLFSINLWIGMKMLLVAIICYYLRNTIKQYLYIITETTETDSKLTENNQNIFIAFSKSRKPLLMKILVILLYIIGSICSDPIIIFPLLKMKPFSIPISKSIMNDLLRWKSVKIFYCIDLFAHVTTSLLLIVFL